MSKLIAFCGMSGSGKTDATKFITANYNIEHIRLGVTEYVLEKYGHTTEDLERKERNQIREEKGMGVFADMVIPKIQKLFKEGNDVLIDNMYSWSEYKIFKQTFKDNFYTVALLAPPKVRYHRQATRGEREHYKDPEIAKARDYSTIEEIEKGGPIAMADYYVLNTGTLKEFHQDLINIFGEIL